MAVYKIHPAIGIARLGNSTATGTDGYYIAPEEAEGLPTNPDTGDPITIEELRDSSGNLKRQAARFKIYEYEDDGTTLIGEIDDYTTNPVEWTVHLANKKSAWYKFQTSKGFDYSDYDPAVDLRNSDVQDRTSLLLDGGSKVFPSVPNTSSDEFAVNTPDTLIHPEGTQQITTLGYLKADAQGRLLVLGGHGISGSTQTDLINGEYANNDNWFDDVSDGYVTARVNGQDVEGAWVIIASPAFVPQLSNIVTLYDTMYDMAVRTQGYNTTLFDSANGGFQSSYQPNYDQEIRPILDRVMKYSWVVDLGTSHHTPKWDLDALGQLDNTDRTRIFNYLRPPTDDAYVNDTYEGINGGRGMPVLAGDNALWAGNNEQGTLDRTRLHGQPSSRYLGLTQTQYFLLQQWEQGNFIPTGTPPSTTLNEADALDRAVLENCAGGAFSPGIEMTWISRNPNFYVSPFNFRFNKKASIPSPLSTDNDPADGGLEPGDATKYMAIPWQADYYWCTNQPINYAATPEPGEDGSEGTTQAIWWWPVQRPLKVYSDRDNPGIYTQQSWFALRDTVTDPNTDPDLIEEDMVEHWKDLGFIVSSDMLSSPPEEIDYVEVERTSDAPNPVDVKLLKQMKKQKNVPPKGSRQRPSRQRPGRQRSPKN